MSIGSSGVRRKVVTTSFGAGKCCWNMAGVFMAGFVCGIQLSLLFPNDGTDQGSWWKVALSVAMAVFFAYQAYITRVAMVALVETTKKAPTYARREP